MTILASCQASAATKSTEITVSATVASSCNTMVTATGDSGKVATVQCTPPAEKPVVTQKLISAAAYAASPTTTDSSPKSSQSQDNVIVVTVTY